MRLRPIEQVIRGRPTQDGAGVRLLRILGTPELDQLDPFLLLDEFRSGNSEDYMAGFPSHPHRGFETVTYLKEGNFRHRDSRGNEGFLGPGSVQWMTAGSGIVHSEMPGMESGLLWGYQLWINLPSRLKMTEPRYQDIPRDRIPIVPLAGGRVVVIAGTYRQVQGPAQTHFPVTYLDVELEPEQTFRFPIPEDHSGFFYLYDGAAAVADDSGAATVQSPGMAVLGRGDALQLRAGRPGARFLLVAGTRLEEPVARAGPFVMNTAEELQQAFLDYRAGRLGGEV